MAKRRKIEEVEIKLPEFNEREYTEKEKRNTKVVVIVFIFALIIAFISQPLWAGMSKNLRWPVIFLFALFMIPFLYKIINSLADTKDYNNKKWFTLYISYLLTWLSIFIILVNPPFYDDVPPKIDYAILPLYQEPGGPVKIAACITDNTGIKSIDFKIGMPNGEKGNANFTRYGNLYIWEFKNTKNLIGRFNFTIKVVDSRGNTRKVNDSFFYSKETIILIYPENGSIVDHRVPVRFNITSLSKDRQTKFSIYYILNGEKINLTRSGNLYETSPSYRGWKKGENVTVRVFAKLIRYFYDGINVREVNNTVIDSSVYTFYTDPNDSNIGVDNPPEGEEFYPPKQKNITPGFETIALILSIIAVVAILGKKKK